MYQSDPVRVELFFHVNAFVGFMLRSENWPAKVKSTHFESSISFARREDCTQHAPKLNLSLIEFNLNCGNTDEVEMLSLQL